jgi:hypothetical protein
MLSSRSSWAAGLGVLVLAGTMARLFSTPLRSAPRAADSLSDHERAEGWRLLFDGKTFAGWRGLGRPDVPLAHWTIEEGAIRKIKSGDVPLQKDGQPLAGGDLMTIETFGDFELAFEWKISPAGNSGVKYNAKNGPNRTAAALYDLIAPVGKRLRPVGEFNTARIVFVGNHGEHWLNGTKVLEFDLGTPRMTELLAKSKYKDIPGFADRRKGHIVLQDHTDAAWFRNIKIRRPPGIPE